MIAALAVVVGCALVAALAVVVGCALVAILLCELVEWSQARRARRNAERVDEALRRHLP